MPTNAVILTPNKGADYQTQSEVMRGLQAGDLFIVRSQGNPDDGRRTTLDHLVRAGRLQVTVLYARGTEVARLALIPDTPSPESETAR